MIAFEPPSSGPSPIVSKINNPNGTEKLLGGRVGDYTNPILKPQAAAIVKKNGEMESRGDVLPNPNNQCWSEWNPFTLSNQFGMQMLQQKHQITLPYLHDHQVLHVRMNVPHSAHLTPTWQGESVGRYEDDTLVIDTIGIKVGPLSMVDLFGTPHTEALHVVERYRLIDGVLARDLQRKHESRYFPPGVSSPYTNEYGRGDIDPDTTKQGLQVEITFDDPDMFTTPWSALVTYRHVLGEWPEAVCAENPRGAGHFVSQVPQAEKPDF
jgi:hypothetical protein